MERNGLIIAIDGPAASGKSTTAKLVASRLGYTYIDTGAMYRAVTLVALRTGVDPADQAAIEKLASQISIRFHCIDDGSLKTFIEAEDVSAAIREPEVTGAVSLVSSWSGVREAMVRLQREMSMEGGVVMDGRDIGTVVFPDADVKVFMVADINARAERRKSDLVGLGTEQSVEVVAHDLERRDKLDSNRDVSPLRKAEDAVEIDTSGLSIEEQVEKVLEMVREVQDSKLKVQNN